MDPSALRKELREKTVRPAYLFGGTQELLKEEALEALAAAAGAGQVRRFLGNDTTAQQILETQRNLSLLDRVSVIVVRNAAKLPQGEGDLLAAELSELTAGPPIVFWDESFDKRRRKVFAAAAKVGAEVDFSTVRRAEAVSWLQARARALGHGLAPRLADEIVELLGVDLMLLATTLEKLSLAVGPGGEIDAATVVALVPAARAHALYELQDAVSSRDALKAVRLFRCAVDEGEVPQLLVGVLAAEVRRLLLAREASPRLDRGAAAQWIGTPPFKVDAVVRNARRFSPEQLRQAVERLHGIDLDSKTGRGDATAALEEWLVWLCAPQPTAGGARHAR